MKVFVFQPTNDFIGKFDVQNEQALSEGLKKFLANRPEVPRFAYVEVEGKAWTILSLDPLRIASGIIRREQANRSNQEEKEKEEADHQRERDAQDYTVAFDCLDCATCIRIRQLQRNSVYRCPSCKTEYKVLRASAEPLVLLLTPSVRSYSHGSAQSTKTAKQIPTEVRNALRVLGLTNEVNFEDVRQSYRDHIKQYHPDLVAHLGPELRVVAEQKTKEFNTAYQILERFYAV